VLDPQLVAHEDAEQALRSGGSQDRRRDAVRRLPRRWGAELREEVLGHSRGAQAVLGDDVRAGLDEV